MKKYILGLLVILGLSSCSDFLDKSSSIGLPVEEAITSLNDLDYGIKGIYFGMTGGDAANNTPMVRGTYSGDFTIYADLRGSDLTFIGDNQQISDVAKYTVSKSNTISFIFYERFYTCLARVNSILEIIDNIPVKESEKGRFDALKGELYALRGLLHFDLARLYAQLPTVAADINAANSGIVLSTEVYDSRHIGTRSTLQETYDQILSDFKMALPLLSKTKTNGRMNYWSALAVRSRTHLYLNKNTEALTDANEVISNSPYKLYTTENYIESWSKEYTDESLLEISITENYNAQRNSLGYYTDPNGYAECGATNEFAAFMQSQTNDIRKEVLVEKVSTKGKNKGFYPNKYPGRDGEVYINNPKIIRLSEVYLIAAEAKVKGGIGENEASSYLNKLRMNRIKDYQDVSLVTLDDILTERRVELFAEGHNAWDYWRNKKSITKKGAVGTVEYTDYRTVLPFYLSEIEISNGALIQNPGY